MISTKTAVTAEAIIAASKQTKRVKIIHQPVRGSSSTFTPIIPDAIKAGNTDRASINKYVSTKSHKGLSKTLKFDAEGEVSGADVNGFIVKNGKLVLLGAIK